MELLRNSFTGTENAAVAIGAFDGIHIGHKRLIDAVTAYAKDNHSKSCVFTFYQNPAKAKLLTTNSQRAELFQSMGVDTLVMQDFTPAFQALEPEAFFSLYLKKARFISVGYNFRFGKGRRGDVALLQSLAQQNGVAIEIIPPVKLDGEPVSSSRIRSCIQDCDFQQAERLLGRPYIVEGIVQEGDKIGAQIGFPTANIPAPDHLMLPPKGVYAAVTTVDGKRYVCITNNGGKPTIKDGVNVIESHLLNFEGTLYGKTISVQFLQKIRDIVKLPSVECLIQQLRRDRETALKTVKL